MSEVSIYKDGSAVSASRRPPSALGQTMASNGTNRRIQTSNVGTFKRMVNGEQVGAAVRGELDIIIANALPKVSRVFYAKQYDPSAEPTLPDCWSNVGDVPEASASAKQSDNCADCKQNIAGSGANGGRACRFQRRLAVLVVGEPYDKIYQLNVPAKSLFGKGEGNVHPFESYVRFLLNNGESPDTVVTTVSYDADADTMQLQFSPVRALTDDEYTAVQKAQSLPEAQSYVKLTVAQVDRVKKLPAATETAASEPTVRTAGDAETRSPDVEGKLASVLGEWADED